MFKNKKVILGGTVVVALAIVMAGTFAWFTDSDEVVNKMKLANFDVKITEDWVEEDNQNLEPNAEVDKVVRVSNNGSAAAVVRVKIEETLKLFEAEDGELKIYWEADPITTEDTDYEDYVAVPAYNLPADAETATVEGTEIEYYTAITSLKNADGTQCYIAVDDEHEGLVRYNPDTKAVEYAYYKYAAETTDTENYFTPAFNTTDWTLVGDYYYYNTVVASGEVTEPLFETVNVSADLPSTYIGSIYHLTPKMEAVQAKAEAITGTWGLAEADFLAGWNLGTTEEETPAPEVTPAPEEQA